MKKSFSWLLPARLREAFARYRKNPSSSRNIDRTVIEMNRTSILSGFIAVFATSAAPTLAGSTVLVIRSSAAPTSVTTQYEPSDIRPSLILGKNSTENIIKRQVAALMTIDGIITYLSKFQDAEF